MEYSFENFTILDKKKNGKADKIHFTVLEDILLRCDCVGVDLFNGLANTKPYTQICKDLYDASLICKRRLLQNGEVFHHAIMYDVLDNLVNKVNLSAVEVSTIQILRKCSFRRSHIKTNDFPHEFSQRLCAIFGFIVLFCANLTPKNFFEFFDIFGSERDVAFQFGNGCIILMLPYIVLSFCLVIFQIIVFQLGLLPFCRKNFVREICGVPYTLDGNVLDQSRNSFRMCSNSFTSAVLI